MHFGLNSLIKV